MLNSQTKLKSILNKNLYQTAQQQHPNSFNLISENYSNDFSILIRRLKHEKSGAAVYHLVNSDPDNCFAPVVKTLPKNSTGCPHILEHLACCGSKKYPIRDPFFNMLKRSTNTYMNAWTGQDFTAYPFSSANPKDFQNLYKVYLDLCLKPNLHQLDFRQEGWRYQYSKNDKGEQIKQIKGIVFNEMKGAYQNADRQMYIEISNKLFAGIPYQFDSGGKPEEIVKLSYQQILDMHQYYYHPSNISFFYYGNQDITPKLEFLETQYLSQYQNEEKKYQLEMPDPSPQQTFYHEFVSPTAESVSLALAYNLGPLEQMNEVDIHCIQILGYLLYENPILYEQFIQKNFASSLGHCGFECSKFCTFKITLKNVQTGDNFSTVSQKFYTIFQEILEKISKGGNGCYRIDQDRLQEIIVQSELNLLIPKQNNGIEQLGNVLPFMNNRLELRNLINVRSNIKKAVNIMKDSGLRTDFIKRIFLDNQKKVVVKQIPKKMASNASSGADKDIIGLDMPEDLIRKQQEDLKKRQQSESQNSLDCLPSLKLTDLVPLKDLPFKVIQTCKLSQNNKINHRQIHIKIDKKNLNFFKFVFRLPTDLNDSQYCKILNVLDLWKYSIIKGMALSTQNLSNKQLNEKLKKCCYDFDITLEKDNDIDRSDEGVNIIFSVACLENTKTEFFNIFKDILQKNVFKKEDALLGFKGYITDSIAHIVNMPMKECLELGTSLVTGNLVASSYNWITQGIKAAASQEIPQEFLQIFPQLLQSSRLTIIEHSENPTENVFREIGFVAIDSTQNQDATKNIGDFTSIERSSVAVTHNYNVNFCSQHYPAPPYQSKDSALLQLFLEILEQDYLHPKIREQGGAYGARSMIRTSGSIALYSYMDPYGENTFKAFDESIALLMKNKMSAQQLQEVKIKVLGMIDRPIPPQKECIGMILYGSSPEKRDKYRSYIENANIDEIMEMGNKYLVLNDNLKKRVIFGKEIPPNFEHEKLSLPEQKKQELKP